MLAAASPATATPTVAQVEHLRRASIDAACVATLRRLADEVRAALAAVPAPGVR